MLRFLKSRLSPILVLLFAALPVQISQAVAEGAGVYRCQVEIEKVIEGLDLGDKKIAKQSVVDIYQAGFGGSRIEATENWLSFKSCKGNLVIRADRNCLIETVYTRGSCNIKGLPNY